MRRAPSLAAAFTLASLLTFVADRADAGCGFYTAPVSATASATALVNDADQVVLVRDGTRFALTMSTNYKGPAEDFAMVVPVPVVLAKENVKTLSPAIFTHLERLTAPRVTEYQERDPCGHHAKGGSEGTAAKPGMTGGPPGGGGGSSDGTGVKIEAQFIAGEYEIVVLSAGDSAGLETWLKAHEYKIPEGAAEALAPYVAQQQKFVVAKVDSKKVKRDENGAVVLSPLRFVYETSEFRLPVRLGLLNAPKGGKQDLIVYVLAKGKRIEAGNLPNVAIPTNVDIDGKALGQFSAFYASLLDATLTKAGGVAAVTEYAWGADGCGEPCTAPKLTQEEIDKLGGDVFPGSMFASELTLTRLHTRYDQATLKDDIVFKTADTLIGGRPDDPGAEKPIVEMKGPSAFQARYAVRHAWKGEITCADPKRGSWAFTAASPPATDLAAAPRNLPLASMVKSPIPALDLAIGAPGFGAPPSLAAMPPKLDPPKSKPSKESKDSKDSKDGKPSDGTLDEATTKLVGWACVGAGSLMLLMIVISRISAASRR